MVSLSLLFLFLSRHSELTLSFARSNQGQESFIHHVDSIPTSLLRPPSSSLHRDLFGSDDDGLTSASRASSPMGSDQGNGGLSAPFSSKLSFLARYRDFFAFYARGDRRQAAALLVLLLTSGVAPKGFYAVGLCFNPSFLPT